MLPFFPNQLQSHAPTNNDPSLQQAAMFNQAQFPIPPGVNLGIQNPNLGAFNAGNSMPLPPMAPSSFLNCPNVPPAMHNSQLGVFPQQYPQFGGVPQNLNQQLLALQLLGQACGIPQNLQQFQGQLQGLNILNSLQPGAGPFLANNLPQNFNQQFAQRNQLGALNSHAPSCLGPNNTEFIGNCAVPALENNDTSFSNAALSAEGNSNLGSLSNQKNFHGSNNQGRMRNHHSIKHEQLGNLRPQMHCAKDGRNDSPKNFSRNLQGSQRNFSRNPQGQRQTEYKRFQKPHIQNFNNTKNNVQRFNGMSGTVQKNRREGKSHFPKVDIPKFSDQRRHIPVKYPENEIRQWIQARRKNHPCRAITEKKSAGSIVNSENTDGDAKLRRQQLKEVLAKQAELGVEVAELPRGYLSESENQAGVGNNSKTPNKVRKRGRHGQDKSRAKIPKFNNKSSHSSGRIIARREPTLLQKLLDSDIKRDNSRILQVFKFMVLNSFFENGTADKDSLDFPLITVKDMQFGNATATGKASDSTCTTKVDLDAGKSCPVQEIEDAKEFSSVDDAGSATEDEDTNSCSSQVDCGKVSDEEHL